MKKILHFISNVLNTYMQSADQYGEAVIKVYER